MSKKNENSKNKWLFKVEPIISEEDATFDEDRFLSVMNKIVAYAKRCKPIPFLIDDEVFFVRTQMGPGFIMMHLCDEETIDKPDEVIGGFTIYDHNGHPELKGPWKNLHKRHIAMGESMDDLYRELERVCKED